MSKLKNTERAKSPDAVRVAVHAKIDALSEKTAKSMLKHIVNKLHAEEFTSGKRTEWDSDTAMDIHSWFVTTGTLDPLLMK